MCWPGGDEFLALTTPEVADVLASRTDPIPGARIGVSINSTVDQSSIDHAIAEADQALYRAKERLRDGKIADAA